MDDPVSGPRRRIVLRRSRGGGSGGFSGGSSTQSESLRTSAEPDEVDDAIDPDALSRRIRSGAVPRPAPASVAPPDKDNPRLRLNQVALAGSSTYAKEYRLQLLHRLLMRNIPLDQIANQLQVSISTVEKDRVELKKRLREAAKEMNIDEMVGGQTAVYDEIAGMALRVASGSGEGGAPTPMRLAAMRTALAANADKTRFLNTAGVFDVLRFRRADDGSNVSDVQHLMARTAELMSAMLTEETAAPPPPRRGGGFQAMTFDDVDASGSASEIQEI